MAQIRLVVEGPAGSSEVAICGDLPSTIAGLIAILGLPAECTGLWVDDRWADANCTLSEAGVVDGALLATNRAPSPLAAQESLAKQDQNWYVEIVGGLQAGKRFPISAGGSGSVHSTHSHDSAPGPPAAPSAHGSTQIAAPASAKPLTAGTSPKCDIALSQVGWRVQQAHLQLAVQPNHQPVLCILPIHAARPNPNTAAHQNPTPTWVEPNTPIQIGNALIQLSQSPQDQPSQLNTEPCNTPERSGPTQITGTTRINPEHTPRTHIVFNRPPRPAPPPTPQPISAPAQPEAKTERPVTFGWAALAAPVVMGLVMTWVYSPYMALFALFSPLMMGASYLDGRRRNRRAAQRSQNRSQAALAEFETATRTAWGLQTARLRLIYPHLSETTRRITQPSVRLWERRTYHEDQMRLVISHGTRNFYPDLVCDGNHINSDTNTLLAQLGPLKEVPITVDLTPNNLLGLTGPRSVSAAIARGLLLQAAALHGPADLNILVATSDSTLAAWTWTAWLPHTAAADAAHTAASTATSTRLIAAHRGQLDCLVAQLMGAWQHQQSTPNTVWPHLLMLVDGQSLVTGRTPPLRPLLQQLAGPASAIVLADTNDQLPESTTAVVEANDASGFVQLTQSPSPTQTVLASGMSLALARQTARLLARYEDPERTSASSGIRHQVSLLELLDLHPNSYSTPSGPSTLTISPHLSDKPNTPHTPDTPHTPHTPEMPHTTDTPNTMANAIARRWNASQSASGLAAPIGVNGNGTVTADLATDGPHALVGGTTGSGKSELLRTWVASLAATYAPEQLNFVLVDYKGGSAFDICASLPHVVGLVTDLDHRLAERALRCLEAELRHREQILRAHGASDLVSYQSLSNSRATGSGAPHNSDAPLPPLARLIIMIDEFAALAQELPHFMDALVHIAQQGRSLGMHLVLATQRPAGAVGANIRTNTALRIALRVLDPADSVDVLDSPEAAAIPRSLPGRAIARFDAGQLMEFQSALASSTSTADQTTQVIPAPDGIPITDTNPHSTLLPTTSAPTHLQQLVTATQAAWAAQGGQHPRHPWPDPLPDRITLEALATSQSATTQSATGVAFALADNPNAQQQYPLLWNPEAGNLLLVGSASSGPTMALHTLAIALASSYSPHECHLYGICAGTPALLELASLPHCGAVIGPDERERLRRLINRLTSEMERRHTVSPATQPDDTLANTPAATATANAHTPHLVTLVCNWGGLAKSLDNVADHTLLTALERLWADGPAVGLHMIATTDHFSTASRTLQASSPQTLVFGLSDPGIYRQWGIQVDDPTQLPKGRGFVIPSGLEAQVATPSAGLSSAIQQIASTYRNAQSNDEPSTQSNDGLNSRSAHNGLNAHNAIHAGPFSVETLPKEVSPELLDEAQLHHEPIYLPVGLSDTTLAPVGLSLHRGEHALLVGPTRSGKSAGLALIAATLAKSGGTVLALASPNSPLARIPNLCCLFCHTEELVAAARGTKKPTFVLIDDAETVLDPDGALKSLATNRSCATHIVAAGNADRLRSAYGHWTTEIRFSKTGILLQPHLLDGDFFSVQLPTHPQLPQLAGRGYLVQNAQLTAIQVAHQQLLPH